MSKNYDNVTSLSHYAEGRMYEPIDVINDWNLNFNLGNAVKYISRAGRKQDPNMDILDKTIEDLKKAVFYLSYEITSLQTSRKAWHLKEKHNDKND